MRNQFFYTVTENVKGSFDITRVIRTQEVTPGKLTLVLDDFHKEWHEVDVPIKNHKGVHTGGFHKEVREFDLNSQIELNEEDSVRFTKLTQVDTFGFDLSASMDKRFEGAHVDTSEPQVLSPQETL